MAVNPSTLLRYIKRKLGASHFDIPLDDKEIMEVCLDESLYTFSKYYPFMYPLALSPKDALNDDTTEKNRCKYYLKTDGLEIMGVAKMYRGEGYINGGLYPRFNSDNIFEMQMNADLGSAVEIPDTFIFIPPNIIETYPKYVGNQDLMVVCKCVHPSHLGTIPLSLRDQFFRLCELDVKISIYQILKNYDQLNTAYGTIDLKLQDYENAEDQRRELLEQWDANFLREPNRKHFWIS